MTNEQIKQLEKQLWDAADDLRANSKLTAAEYKDPVLGLILLRFAQNRFEDAKVKIEKELPINPRTNEKRALEKSDFVGEGAIFIQEKSKYDYLANLPEGEDINEAVNEAMRLIEADYEDFDFYSVYSICKLPVIYTVAKVYPEAGAYAPCSLYMYKKQDGNNMHIAFPSVYNWISSMDIKDEESLKTLEEAQASMHNILTGLTE